MAPSQQEPIAVVGMACRFSGGSDSPSKLWELLRAPRDLGKRVPADRFDSTGYFHTNGSHHGATDCQDAYFLEEDVTRFDNAFFNIQPGEAEAIDPQQRLLMEVVYDSLCAAGQTVEGLRGSRTAVFVGQMCDDWSQMSARDWDLMPTYAATGQSRAIVSNRVSYFFDWHGPSMTVDTACSSSLVAVHQGVSALRNGECPVAFAAGVNLILAPGMWIAESNLHMLSPTGRSRMWDASADGYARGEGVASVVLKTLSAALRDGDHIDCVIRETGVNQDGRTPGLTMPSNIAQADLIRETYKRAGLDIENPRDRPQFFHAHGTGTPAGDPQEAEAISSAFFESGKVKEPLYVGSIKTVLGHTEGAAGLASLIGTSLAMQHGVIAPNLHFNELSPRVAPFCAHLQVPTTARPWPDTVPGQPRRASINSFGFGGTNAHAIIERFECGPKESTPTLTFTPITISASSSAALRTALFDLRSHLSSHPEIDLDDLKYTLQARRSTLAFRTAVTCGSIEEAINRIDDLLADDVSGENKLTARYFDVPKPSILGVFTGQGAQWPRMGAQLIEESPYVAKRIAELDAALSSLPASDRPKWTLRGELLADPSVGRLSEAAVAQPLCTAVQIVLVDLLRLAKIQLRAVVGHSSGEIAAAYAAGFLSATDAIRIAYYRGYYAHLAVSGSASGAKGAMMAVGTSYEDGVEFCSLDDFAGRIQVAARNSLTSITLSGDEDAIEEAMAIFKDEGRFARQLRVDTAYHSHHMKPCAAPYLDALRRCNITTSDGNDTTWFSSAAEGQIMSKAAVQESQYWVDNMTNAVLFAPAIADAVAKSGPFDIAIEFGPHPALKGPCLDTMEEASGSRIPYTGLLSRSKKDVDELASALGFVWTHLGAESVEFDGFEKLISSRLQQRRVLTDLPAYPFDHSRSFYTLSRYSGSHRNVHAPPHPLLGRRCVETETGDQVSWRNVLRQNEISWLQGHQLQGQIVFPAMGYVSMAVEAAAALAGTDQRLGLITLEDVVIGRALAFSDENTGMESKVTLKVLNFTDDELRTQVACYSGLLYDNATPLALNFSASVTITFHQPGPDTLPTLPVDEINLVDVEPERFYRQFTDLGYNYSPPFTGVQKIQRKMGFAIGDIHDTSGDGWEDQLIVHPGWLDSAIQTSFAAYSHPHDGRLWALHVPTAIRSITINPYFVASGASRNRHFMYQATTREAPEAPIEVDVDVFAGAGQSHAAIQFECIQARPFAAANPRDDAVMFSRFSYKPAGPDAIAAVGADDLLPPENAPVVSTAERMGFFYLRRLYETITPAETAAALPHFKHLLAFAGRMVSLIESGRHPNVPSEAMADSHAFIRSLAAKYHHRADIRLVEAAGENLITEVRRGGSMLEHMMKDGLLDRLYEESAGLDVANVWFGRIIAQISHRHPRIRLLEIGAGTGGSTRVLLPMLGDGFSTYTFTDISAGFFERAHDRFSDFADRMVFATYDMERRPADQGFEEGTYDVVLASNVLHACGKLDDMMANVRRLLRPGGYLITVETISNYFLHIDAIMGGLPGWWAGAEVDPSRCDGPCLTLEQWDKLASRHGFGGVDTHTPVEHKLQSYAVFVCQAVDDRVSSLRNPLLDTTLTLNADSNHLVVVGGTTAAVNRLAEETRAMLRPHYASMHHLASLDEFDTHILPQGSSILCLTELDEQFLEARSSLKLDALKRLWRHGRTILWVTRGARADSPYSAMMLGLSRVIRYENPNLNLQLLDFDASPSPKVLSEALIRLELGESWKREGVDLLWSVEPEIHHVQDQVFIPRLYPDTNLNGRYNTYRRSVQVAANPQETTVVLEPTPGGQAFELCTVSPCRVPTLRPNAGKAVTLRVNQSLLQVLKIQGLGFFAVCEGTDVETGQQLVALVDGTVESCMSVPVGWTAPAPGPTGSIISAIATYFLAQSILASAPRVGTVVVHEADGYLKQALEKEAIRESVCVVFTTVSEERRANPGYVFVHERLPQRLLKKLIPRDTVLFVDLSLNITASGRLTRGLLMGTATATVANFVGTKPCTFSGDFDEVGQVLRTACKLVTRQTHGPLTKHIPFIPLKDVVGHAVNASLSIVDWNTPSVQVALRPIDYGNIFRSDGTYFLVGLASELGQSLCNWMVSHGARHVVLSSRSPKVDPQFIASIEAAGAKIKIVAIDVTRRDSLRSGYDAICAEMPPIIGVANGAMILEDKMFDDLEFASLDRQAAPKVDGSVLLDELFYDAPLDFFILFCSIANISGNTGQSPYIMANQFMTALAAQRRDVRGVAGSAMAISSVQGLGYFEHANRAGLKDYFVKRGYRNISEQDLHQQFAEAMLAGKPGSAMNSEVVTGIIPFRDDPTIQAQLRLDPKFRHFALQDVDANADLHDQTGSDKIARPRARLAKVKSFAEAITVVQEAFIDRLKRILMIPSSDPVHPQVSLVELGADSIMAVDVRAWFLKELEVDVPVLKILGAGETIAGMVEDVLRRIPAELLDLGKLEDKIEADPAPPVERRLEVDSSEEASVKSSTGLAASIGTSNSPYMMPTPITLPDDDESEAKRQNLQLANDDRREGSDWRRAILDSSTEHVEQMTFGQKRFWFLNHYVDEATTFNIAYMGKLTGPLRADDLASALKAAAQRHESLRTRFFWSDDDSKKPMQGILSKSLVRLEAATIDLEAQAIEAYDEIRNYEWDLGDWLPLRVRLLSLSDTVHYLVMGTHHISMDGHSFNILMLEMNELYNNPGQALPLLPDTSQVRALGEHQRTAHESGQFQPAIDYFRTVLSAADLAHPIELFPFSHTQIRPPLDRYSTHVARVRLESDVALKLKQLARAQRATSFHAYLATFQALLFRLLPTTDTVLVGIADANRLDSRFMGSIGNLLNVLPLRFNRVPGGAQTFGRAIEAAREGAYGALKHSGLPFDLLLDELSVPRSNAWAPVFQVFLDYRLVVREHANKSWAGCRIEEERWHASKSGYDVALEIVEDHEGAMLAMHVQSALYDEAGAGLLVRSFANALRQFAREGPALQVGAVEAWDGHDVKAAVEVGKGPGLQLTWPATVAHRIDEVISQYPNSIALKDGDGRALTYAKMDERVESIARALVSHLPDSDGQAVVGVFQMPSADWICSLLAIHRVGATYLPLDLRNSIPRLRANVKAVRPAAILVDSEMQKRMPEVSADKDVAVINISGLSHTALERRTEAAAKPDCPAYIIFTSGSTGEPKGIVVTHAGLRANLEGYHRAWDIPAVASVVLQNAAYSFDASLLQIYAALTTGGCLLVVPADARGDPVELTRLMADHKVTMTQATPSEYEMWFRFAAEGLRCCTAWKAAWFGGERAGPKLLDGFRELRKALPGLHVFTSYGPTEATISSMKGEVDVGDPSLTVPVPGRLLPNYAAYIVDGEMRPVPVDVPGEILLGGAGVDGNQYLNRPDLTATHFLADTFSATPNEERGRVYRTGDYGRLDARGYLTIEARITGDTQVKLRGFRIELTEIERVIISEADGDVAQAVVTLRGDNEDESFLAAHVVRNKKQPSQESSVQMIDRLRTRLPLHLPQYMCPAIIVPLDGLPLTIHSKVDRRAVQALALPEMDTTSVGVHQALTPMENRLASLWTAVLPQRALTQPLTTASDFFLVGGNSLLLVKLQAAVKRAFGDAPRLSKLLSAPELGSMAALIQQGLGNVDWETEIALDPALESSNILGVQKTARKHSDGLHILVTGATGSLGRRVVEHLAADKRVAHIICLVRPSEGRDLTTLFHAGESEGRICVLAADLPSLPDEKDLAPFPIDAVLHCAADRSFWDSYGAFKAVNVDAVKVLVRLALRAGATLHALSSGAVAAYETDSSGCLPQPSPEDGYVASKWVAERYLARAARQKGLRVTAHRPTRGAHDDVQVDEAVEKLADDILLLSRSLGLRPDFSHLSGTLCVARLRDVAGAVAAAVVTGGDSGWEHQANNPIRVIEHPGTTLIRIEALGACVERLCAQAENDAVQRLPGVPALQWVGTAKRAGLFEWFFTAQDLVIADEEGRTIAVKR